MENSYASKDMGGYMEENLIKPLTDLAEEGYSFSNNPTGLGGPVATTGCTWSVASMVNMNGGIPMKVTTGGNLYGSADNFMPGAITIGDILESQGYEQSLMFGASARFGGLNFFYESHGDFTILDYNAAKEKGWIPKDYKVWWGYEDDKLYEYAKAESQFRTAMKTFEDNSKRLVSGQQSIVKAAYDIVGCGVHQDAGNPLPLLEPGEFDMVENG